MTLASELSGPAKTLMRGDLKENSIGNLAIKDNKSEASILRYEDARSQPEPESIDFLKDDKSEQTWGRRIAMGLIDQTWYNPRAAEDDDDNEQNEVDLLSPQTNNSTFRFNRKTSVQKPSLKKAWAYFEHVALYRYIVEEKPNRKKKDIIVRAIRKFQKGNMKLEKAEPGEKDLKTKLYDPIFTPHSQLGDFGLGMGLYFATLRAIFYITLICGLVSAYNINYFASDEYQPAVYRDEINFLMRGSAICTMTSWVPCPNCTCAAEAELDDRSDSRSMLPKNRCGTAVSLGGDALMLDTNTDFFTFDEVTNFTVALRNDCDGTPLQLGAVNYATVIILFLATIGLGEYLRKQEVQFDEDEQTAQDYSIRISNPPSDAKDPEEWRRFFVERCDGAQVTVCTCAVDNDLLVRTLLERREILQTIENILPPGTSMDNYNLAKLAAGEERGRNWLSTLLAPLAHGIPELYARLVALDAKVIGLSQLEYPVTNVFLTFETEKDQRHVLEKLSIGSLSSYNNDVSALSDKKYLFRDNLVLAVSEPDEPSTIRWQDLNAKFIAKLKILAFTSLCTMAAIIVVAVVVRVSSKSTIVGSAIAISVFNSAFPIFAKILTGFEAHAAEGEKQTSLYFKIALFRWVNTAIVITIITPFTDTLALGGLIPQIYTLFFAEIVTTNAIQLLDPMGHIQRHFLAPRAKTQDAMNLNFQGAEFELAERYTDMTKILFLCVWYCSIYPGAFFMCSFSLFVKYFTDRFSLMRSWKRAPQLGTRVSKFSRRYFFSLACVAMVVISSFYWSGFPFDNICPDENISYTGNFTVIQELDEDEEVKKENVTFTNEDLDYRFCSQDLIRTGLGSGLNTFPFVPSNQPVGDEWMNEDQEMVTLIFGWTSVVITVLVFLKFVWGWVDAYKDLFYSSYKTVGDDQGIPFSEVASRSGYIPQVISGLFSYPLIACNSDDVDEELYEWTDPDRPYKFYDLTKDADELLSGMKEDYNAGFTFIKHWPPGQKLKDSVSAGGNSK